MIIEVLYQGEWVDVVPMLSNDAITGTYEDIAGLATGTNIPGMPILDIVNQKYPLELISRYLTESESVTFKRLFADPVIDIRTDYFEETEVVSYKGYRGNISKAKITDAYSKYSLVIDCYL